MAAHLLSPSLPKSLATAETKCVEQLLDDRAIGGRAKLRETVDDGADGQVGPQHVGLDWIARGVNFEDFAEVGFQLLVGIDAPFASTPFFRDRSGGTSGSAARSTKP